MNDLKLQNAIISKGQSRLCVSTWPNDKYPDAPELNAKSKVIVMNEDGPGVISNIHVSNYVRKNCEFNWSEPAVASLILRVWYDREDTPSIEMPLMDFLGDIQYSSSFFNSIYFSKVKHSHNFRLAMPFKNHIKIEVENPTEVDLSGYTEIQWEKISSLPENCGYLFVDYRSGNTKIPHEIVELCNINSAGTIVAHWFQIEADHPGCKNGELLCEANNEFYLDGDIRPTMEYQGTEDYYGYSWGFPGVQSDNYGVILKVDELTKGGARIALLRCRDYDKIRFEKSCRIFLDYTQEYFSELSTNPRHKENLKVDFEAQFRSCYYYYCIR